jgi:hypothetical protein
MVVARDTLAATDSMRACKLKGQTKTPFHIRQRPMYGVAVFDSGLATTCELADYSINATLPSLSVRGTNFSFKSREVYSLHYGALGSTPVRVGRKPLRLFRPGLCLRSQRTTRALVSFGCKMVGFPVSPRANLVGCYLRLCRVRGPLVIVTCDSIHIYGCLHLTGVPSLVKS